MNFKITIMSNKTTLSSLFVFVILMCCLSELHAQQHRAMNNPFIQLHHPSTDPAEDARSNSSSFTRSPNRTFDGTNNNLGSTQKKLYGSANIALYRELAAVYGSADPKNAMGGASRPSPRDISNAVIDEPVTDFSDRRLSSFVYVWGQFIDHDITLTPTGNAEYVPVPLPANEVVFTEQIPFYRSEVRSGTGTTNARQQSNLNTAWIDGSVVYGSDAVRAKWLRTFSKGKMKVSAGNFLPWNTITGEQADAIDPAAPDMANDNGHTVKTFVAGDVRASEHPGILSLHTLFVREHNRICDRLYAQGMRKDEDIYQRARKEVGGLIEAITYQEWLPAVGITLRPYYGYNANVRPDIMNTFATAGYRLGHTMVADDIMMLDNQCNGVGPVELDLLDAFWVPDLVPTYNVEPFLKGLSAHIQYETDTKINSVLRNFLFGSPNDPVRFGIDLGSLNIQRGRDHGLPDYNTVRRYYTGRAAVKFSDITSNKALADSLQRLYGNVNNVDLWIGILAEDHLPGKSVGKTVHEMLRVQFENIRDGDYYFFKYDPYLPLSSKLLIANTRMSDVIKRNSTLTNVQRNVFFAEECPGFPSEEARIANNNARQLMNGTASTDRNLNADTRLYPNPVTDILNIDLGNQYQESKINVLSDNGTLLRSLKSNQKNVKVDLSIFAKGIYFISINNKNGTKNYRVVKL